MTQPEIIYGVIQDPGMDTHAVSLVNPPQAWLDVLQERQRQVTGEGWTPEHDDLHVDGEMAAAAACYALSVRWWEHNPVGPLRTLWPWEQRWWKPGTFRRNLVKAAALILAEIERLDRAEGREMTRAETNAVILSERERQDAKRLLPVAMTTFRDSAYIAIHIAIAAGDPRTEALYRLARDIDALVDNWPAEKETK